MRIFGVEGEMDLKYLDVVALHRPHAYFIMFRQTMRTIIFYNGWTFRQFLVQPFIAEVSSHTHHFIVIQGFHPKINKNVSVVGNVMDMVPACRSVIEQIYCTFCLECTT